MVQFLHLPYNGVGVSQPLLCLLAATSKSEWLLSHSSDLVTTAVRADRVNENEDDPDVEEALAVMGPDWAGLCFCVVTAKGGVFEGLRAVGLASNKKVRGRLARVALATSARLCHPGAAAEDPSQDGEFAALIKYAGEVRDKDTRRIPPSVPSQSRTPRRGMPPPPLPPQASQAPSFILSMEPANAAQGARGSGATVSEGGAISSAGGGVSGGGGSIASSGGLLRYNGSLNGKAVVVTQDYDAESSGYLSLRRGDRLRLTHGQVELGGNLDRFKGYVFGVRGESSEDAGWFPADLAEML